MDSSYFDVTWCSGIACGHPSCWNSQRKIIRGQARVARPSNINSSRTFDNIPTQKIKSMNENLFGYDDWMGDVNRERSQAFVNYVKTRSKPSLKSCLTPPNSNNDRDTLGSSSSVTNIFKPKVRQLEPQEIISFDDTDHQKNSVQNSKFSYIWVPNPAKMKRKRRMHSLDDSAEFLLAPVISRDVTKECFIQQNSEKENSYIPCSPVSKKPSSYASKSHKSPIKGSPRHYALPPVKSSSFSQKMQEKGKQNNKSVASLMEMKPEVLADVLDHIEQGELASPENIERVVRSSKHIKKSAQEINLDSAFEQKKAPLHDPEDKLKQSEIHSSQPVFRLDNCEMSELPATEPPNTDRQHQNAFLSHHLPLPPIVSEHSKDLSTLQEKSKLGTDAKSSVTRAHSTAISNISAQFDDQNNNLLSRKRNELIFNPKYGPPVQLFLGPICGSMIHEEAISETPCSDDSRSINVTVSTDRSTLYQEVLPGVKTFQPRILAITSDEMHALAQEPNPSPQSFIPITQNESSPDEGEVHDDRPDTQEAEEAFMLTAFESLFQSEEMPQNISTNSMSNIIEIEGEEEEEEEEEDYTSDRYNHLNKQERIVEIPIGEFENEEEEPEENNQDTDILPPETNRLPFPPPPSPEASSRRKPPHADEIEMNNVTDVENEIIQFNEEREKEDANQESENLSSQLIEESITNIENQDEESNDLPVNEDSITNIENQDEESSDLPVNEESIANIESQEEESNDVPVNEDSITNIENQDEKSNDVPVNEESIANIENQDEESNDVPVNEESIANIENQDEESSDLPVNEESIENMEDQDEESNDLSVNEESIENIENQEEESSNLPVNEESIENIENQDEESSNLPVNEESIVNNENQDEESSNVPVNEESIVDNENQDEESSNVPVNEESIADNENQDEESSNVPVNEESITDNENQVEQSEDVFALSEDNLKETRNEEFESSEDNQLNTNCDIGDSSEFIDEA